MLFEAKIKPETIKKRAQRQKISTNVDNPPTPRSHMENQKKQKNQTITEQSIEGK